MKQFFLFLTGLFLSVFTYAGTIDSVSIYSKAMKNAFKALVIMPDDYKNGKETYPVLYLLHGYGGSFSNWITRVPQLQEYVDIYKIIIICPEGKNSWYFDNPADKSSLFETYIAKEVPDYMDQHYRTIKKRTGRAITGLSMGGHGGIYLGLRHTPVFGACGTMSGGVDLKPFAKSWEIGKWLGDTAAADFSWTDYSAIDVLDKPLSDSLAIIIDCGINDFFFEVNKQLHEKLLRLNIAHDYIARPGTHNWDYWSNAIKYQLLYFHTYFENSDR